MSYPVSTSIHLVRDEAYRIPIEEIVGRTVGAGFRYLDFNFLDLQNSLSSPFVQDDWLRFVDRAGETAAKYGACFNQAHAPVHNGVRYPGMTDADVTRFQERAIIACERLGIPWMVFHAIYTSDSDWFAINHRIFDPLLEFSRKHGVGIALENTWVKLQDVPLWRTETLIELADSFHDPMVGICWDTGHCNVYGGKAELKQYTNQYTEITKLGKRLKALHIDDNFGVVDDHLAPFEGLINWSEVMRALRDIGYEHSFTFEAHNAVRRIPMQHRALFEAKMRYLHEVGETLVRWDGELID